ncbi:MAG: hypothetical protein ACI4V4_01920 [Eubacterium sp.]
MPKINSANAKGLIIKYLLKIIATTVLSVLMFNSVFSLLILKCDIDLNVCKYVGIAICLLTALIVSYISIGGFKNNILPLSFISVFPFLLFVIVNFCVHGGDATMIFIKIIVILAAAFISSLLRIKGKHR